MGIGTHRKLELRAVVMLTPAGRRVRALHPYMIARSRVEEALKLRAPAAFMMRPTAWDLRQP